MKQFKNVLVLIADVPGEEPFIDLHGLPNGTPECTSFTNPVRVTKDFNMQLPPLGRAQLHWEGYQLLANLEIFAEGSVNGLYPCIGGIMDSREPLRVRVAEISLCRKNSDPRIPAIEEGLFHGNN